MYKVGQGEIKESTHAVNMLLELLDCFIWDWRCPLDVERVLNAAPVHRSGPSGRALDGYEGLQWSGDEPGVGRLTYLTLDKFHNNIPEMALVECQINPGHLHSGIDLPVEGLNHIVLRLDLVHGDISTGFDPDVCEIVIGLLDEGLLDAI
jgi:hypothetical protein